AAARARIQPPRQPPDPHLRVVSCCVHRILVLGSASRTLPIPLHIATFACDVTPPLEHPLCGGWIEPVRGVDDPLLALRVVLLGPAAPVVLCAVDWCGIRNDAHLIWRQALAKAAHTTPERVALQCVHPHNAPCAETEAQKLIEAAKGPPSLDLKYFDKCVSTAADAVKAALMKTVEFTHLGTGQAKVDQ